MNLLFPFTFSIIHLQQVLASQKAHPSSTSSSILNAPGTLCDSAPENLMHSYPIRKVPKKIHNSFLLDAESSSVKPEEEEEANKRLEEEKKQLMQIHLSKMATCTLSCTQRYLKWQNDSLPEILKKRRGQVMTYLQALRKREEQIKAYEEFLKKEKAKPRMIKVLVHPTTVKEMEEVRAFHKSYVERADRGDDPEVFYAPSMPALPTTSTIPDIPLPILPPLLVPENLHEDPITELSEEELGEPISFIKETCTTFIQEDTSTTDSSKKKKETIIIEGGIEITDETEDAAEEDLV